MAVRTSSQSRPSIQMYRCRWFGNLGLTQWQSAFSCARMRLWPSLRAISVLPPISAGGCPNALNALHPSQGFSIASWNARALCAVRAHAYNARRRYLGELLAKNCIVVLQEVHGTLDDVLEFLRPFSSHKFRFFPGPDPSTGGLLIGVEGSSARLLAEWEDESLCDGRVVRSILRVETPGRQELVIYNVHRENIPAHITELICDKLRSDLGRARQNPLGYVVIVLGDFNLPRSGDIRQYLNLLDQA
eukprot:157168-Karenia_brevis.AAC.1